MQADLPGADLVQEGVADLPAGRETVAAMLVAMASPRLRALGLDVPPTPVEVPSHRLYALLSQSEGDGAHSRYNALVR